VIPCHRAIVASTSAVKSSMFGLPRRYRRSMPNGWIERHAG
jgi:hypothetical protein